MTASRHAAVTRRPHQSRKYFIKGTGPDRADPVAERAAGNGYLGDAVCRAVGGGGGGAGLAVEPLIFRRVFWIPVWRFETNG
jgi:hypothetical protein